jgi:hypothetical protein
MLEQVKNATGIDMEKLAKGGSQEKDAKIPKDLG